ncbi:hypothetical protein ASG42_30085 [Rhizobium sp. Leaf391]|uniref:hypothetical protein n=1 Tax=Rhizobium sp. Leaf391 TaxID=1736360 RepID=UPI0007146A29|nr:hypothetical protein [Rhizobium sp. Leaf391]KQS95320.1 hypothetical protein ASG42_30085 [Rhizobium sp. Leaf391]
MTETYSKSRQQAETAFGDLQTEFFAKNNAEEVKPMAQARAAKTVRLREARLAKEQADRISATSALLAKRSKSN